MSKWLSGMQPFHPYQGTNGDRRGGFWANPGVKFSVTFLILRTVFQTKAIFMACISWASPCSPPLLILPFPLVIFLFYLYQVSLPLNNPPNTTPFSQPSLFLVAIHFYFSRLLFFVPLVLTDPFSSWLAEAWLRSHCSTVTAQGKVSSGFHLITLAGPFSVSSEKCFIISKAFPIHELTRFSEQASKVARQEIFSCWEVTLHLSQATCPRSCSHGSTAPSVPNNDCDLKEILPRNQEATMKTEPENLPCLWRCPALHSERQIELFVPALGRDA